MKFKLRSNYSIVALLTFLACAIVLPQTARATSNDTEGTAYCTTQADKTKAVYNQVMNYGDFLYFRYNHITEWTCNFFETDKSCCCIEDGSTRSCKKIYTGGDKKVCGAEVFGVLQEPGVITLVQPYPTKAEPNQPEPTCEGYNNNKYCCCRPTTDPTTGKTKKECTQTFYSQACNAATFGAENPGNTNNVLTGLASDNTTKVDSGYDKPVIIAQGQDCTALADKANISDTKAAQTSLGDALTTLQQQTAGLNKLHFTGIPTLIGQIMVFFLWSLGAFSFVLYMYAGVLWMTSGGNAEQITQAKGILLWTTLGLIAVFGSSIIVTQVFKFIRVGGTI